MLTLQRLPLPSIVGAHVDGKIFLQEDPTPADSGGGNEPGSGTLAQCRRVQLQEGGCILEIERAHRPGSVCQTCIHVEWPELLTSEQGSVPCDMGRHSAPLRRTFACGT